MNSTQIKTALFVIGSALAAGAVAFPAYSEYLLGLGGLFVGWSGLRRPGDRPE